MRRTEKIVSALEEALATVTQGDWHFDDNFALSVTSDNPSEMAIQHSRGRNGESDMRYIALCSPENIRTLLAERRTLLAAYEQEPVGEFYEADPGNWYQRSPGDKAPKWTPLCAHPAPSIPVTALTITDEQIDALLDSPGNLSYVIADKRERLRLFARDVLDVASPSIPATVPEEVTAAILDIAKTSGDGK